MTKKSEEYCDVTNVEFDAAAELILHNLLKKGQLRRRINKVMNRNVQMKTMKYVWMMYLF